MFLSLWIKQTFGLMGLCHIKPAGACAALTANTEHCAELAIDRAADGEIGNGADNRVVIPGTKRGAELLPSTHDLPVAGCREGRRDFGAQISPFANPPKLLHHQTCCRARVGSALC